MENPQVERKAPRVVFVAPIGGSLLGQRRWLILVWFAIASIGTSLVIGWTAFSIGVSALFGCAFFLLFSSIFLGITWLLRRRRLRARAAFIEQHPDWERDPLVHAYEQVWDPPDRIPKADKVREATESTKQEEDDGRALVICFGHVKIPEVGELQFEPEIITPTARIWRALSRVLVAVALLALLLLDLLGFLPSWFPPVRSLIGGFTYLLAMGFVVLVIWIWRGMIRPTYIRIAPGIIQVLVYGYSRSKPSIRSYPMESGTIVYFTRIYKHLLITLLREEQKDTISLTNMRDAMRVSERALEAIFSTAPIPAMSEDELLG